MYCGNCFRETQEMNVCPFCGFDMAAAQAKFPLALKAGSILNGRYITGRVLGQGGFGITYLAFDDKTQSYVAIKEYLPSEFASRSTGASYVSVFSENLKENYDYGKQMFLEEAKTLASFRGDEHIVRVSNYFEENRTAYFAMEYVEGEPLDAYMKSHGGILTPEEANALLLPLMEALEQVHARGIVHRDIAPDNIIVQPDGKAKLIDFGAARYSTGEKSKSLDVVIKHGFAPYEQYLRRGRQGPFTDVYAMAATYYYAITGVVPPESVGRLQEDTLVRPGDLGIRIDRQAEEALLRALEVSLPNRFQTMGDFRRALTGAAPAETQPAAVPPRSEERPAPAPAAPKKSGPPKWLYAAIPVVLLAAILPFALKGAKKPAEPAPAVAVENTAIPEAEEAPAATPEPTEEPEAPAEEETAYTEPLPKVAVGETMTFGAFEQDNDRSNGAEPIEWLVIAEEDGRVLVISRYALDCRQFYKEYAFATWEDSDLRKWMNGSFLNEAFTPEEQARIPEVTVSADVNHNYRSIDPGNNTKDRVFALSIKEAKEYLSTAAARKCAPTAYAKEQGCYVKSGCCRWWLRTPGYDLNRAANVDVDGAMYTQGTLVTYDNYAVRPAMWIDLG